MSDKDERKQRRNTKTTVRNVERNKINVVIFTNLKFIPNKVKGRFSWEEY